MKEPRMKEPSQRRLDDLLEFIGSKARIRAPLPVSLRTFYSFVYDLLGFIIRGACLPAMTLGCTTSLDPHFLEAERRKREWLPIKGLQQFEELGQQKEVINKLLTISAVNCVIAGGMQVTWRKSLSAKSWNI